VDAWVTRYIFPGGYLPTVAQMAEPMGALGLYLADLENLRLHYALTLDQWSERFERNVEAVRDSFGDSFVRMWRLYLHGSAAAFRWGHNRVFQLTFTNGLPLEQPLTRSPLYCRPFV
jgi:cyclopropane-fatty-acyl-phospholipid synthase